MRFKDTSEEFNLIIEPILKIEEFNKLKGISHHGITRFDHSLRVAYMTYKVCKFLRLNYKEATEAALLHDFFIDEVENENKISKLTKHPEYAVKNSLKYFDLSNMQIDIIKTHMFPVTFIPPKYLESIIVDLLDDFSAVSEKYYTCRGEINGMMTLFMLLFINFF